MADKLSMRAKYLATAKSAGIPGVIIVTPASVKWNPNDPKAATKLDIEMMSIKDYKSSKQSSSKKALLNLCTHSQGGYIFEYENFSARDSFRDFAAKYIRKQSAAAVPEASTSKTPSEPGHEQLNLMNNIRMKLLQEDSELQKSHQNLVINGVLSEEEFWANKKHLLKSGPAASRQRTGLKSTMLADVRPMTDGRTNKVTFNLTPEIIYQIFAEKPAVHKAFLQVVPSKMTELEFWQKYCRIEFNCRTKNAATVAAEAAEDDDSAVFFSDDEAISNEARRKVRKTDPTVDLASDLGDDYLSLPGHGIFRNENNEVLEKNSTVKKARLMRDLNRHGAVVLEGRPLDADLRDTALIAHALAKSQQEEGLAVDETILAMDRMERVHRMTELEDLQGPHGPSSVPLSIQDPRKYFDSAKLSSGASTSSLDPLEAIDIFRAQLNEIRRTDPKSLFITPSLASQVLNEFTQSLTFRDHSFGGSTEKNVLDTLPSAISTNLLQYSATINELLQHFWAAYPITSRNAEKVDRWKDHMAKIYNQIVALKEGVQAEHRHQVSRIVQPMLHALDAAFQHHDTEAQKKTARRVSDPMQNHNSILVT